MGIVLFVVGVVLLLGSGWLLRSIRARPDGSSHPMMARRGVSEVIVFAVLGGIVLGLGMMVKAFTG